MAPSLYYRVVRAICIASFCFAVTARFANVNAMFWAFETGNPDLSTSVAVLAIHMFYMVELVGYWVAAGCGAILAIQRLKTPSH